MPLAVSRVMLLVAYDGSGFCGFAPQPERRTVGGVLAGTLAEMSGHAVALTCAGRTDAGVHAEGQVVHADLFLESGAPTRQRLAGEGARGARAARLARQLTAQLGPEIAVLESRLAPIGFDARRSALSRRYRYDILTGAGADPLRSRLSWHVPGHLDLPAMRTAADALVGVHDFSAFCKQPPRGSMTRRVVDAVFRGGLGDDGRVLRFEIEANAFCHHMVRSLVGTLVAVGAGRTTAAALLGLLRTGDRRAAARSSKPAPPQGLVLSEVRYPKELVGSPEGIWRSPR
ncbi:MAG: tRNA pseudouridine(38-40) synthase TruA [Acidimicrobiales bacterium]